MFDLETDPDERTDRIDDPELAPHVERLRRAMDAEIERLGLANDLLVGGN